MRVDASAADSVPVDRYWLRAGESYSLTAEGWLDAPAGGRLYRSNSHAVGTRDLSAHACLVLLGEPGIGKTTSLDVVGPMVPLGHEPEILHFDLGTFSSEERLARRVFENDTITNWAGGSGTLCLILDGFDEAHSRIQNLHRMVGEYLSEWDCSRLFLRIACRTADWPSSLRSVLDEKFGDANVYELLPILKD